MRMCVCVYVCFMKKPNKLIQTTLFIQIVREQHTTLPPTRTRTHTYTHVLQCHPNHPATFTPATQDISTNKHPPPTIMCISVCVCGGACDVVFVYMLILAPLLAQLSVCLSVFVGLTGCLSLLSVPV